MSESIDEIRALRKLVTTRADEGWRRGIAQAIAVAQGFARLEQSAHDESVAADDTEMVLYTQERLSVATAYVGALRALLDD